MKFILSSYNYYPLAAGGTEVYTRGLASFLKNRGHDVLVIAGFDAVPAIPHKIVEDDHEMKAISYRWNDVPVCLVKMKNVTVEDIYALQTATWTVRFTRLLKQMGFDQADYLLMNGLTTVSGLSLLNAFYHHNPNGRSAMMVHTAFVCNKADMVYTQTRGRCLEQITPLTCSACTVSHQTGLPYFFGKIFHQLASQVSLPFPGSVFQLKNLLESKIHALATINDLIDHWIVFSNDMKRFLTRQPFITNSKIAVIGHGIDKEIFYPGLRAADQPIHFLYAGRMEKIKGIDLLLAAWSQLPQDPARRKLTVVGKPGDARFGKFLKRLIASRKDVQLIEGISQSNLAQQYRAAHCVIIPSRVVETGPLVFHEAISCGCDVITSNLGGQRELAARYRGKAVLFERNDAGSLRDAIAGYEPSGLANHNSLSEAEHFDQLCVKLGHLASTKEIS